MKVVFRYSFVLDNIDYSEIWQPERIAIGKAVFFSMKYNATLGEVSAALGSSYIDSIEVDGYPTVSEYQDIAGGEVEGRILRPSEYGRDEDVLNAATLWREKKEEGHKPTLLERVRGYFGYSRDGQHRRTSTPSTYLEFSANIVTSTRYQEQWEETEKIVTERLTANINSGYFDSIMQSPGPYITHVHGGGARGALELVGN